MMRRWIYSIAFGVAGMVSVLAWASIDARLCATYERLCMPRAGECGGGLDACPVTTHVVVDLIMYLLAPPILFAGMGYFLGKKNSRGVAAGKCLVMAVAAHWLLTFIGARAFHI